MAFVLRFGGWRPVEQEHGTGSLRLEGGETLEPVGYRFEVWHQMVDGFPGPFRSEGTLELPVATPSRIARGRAVLTLEDGRRLALRLAADGTFLAHVRPEAAA